MTTPSALAQPLAAGIAALELPVIVGQIDQLLAFLALLQKWGKTYNLTAIRDARTAVDLHLLDSLAVSPYLQGQRILDVGTGAGLPGIPLAIVNERRHFVLLDCSAKKIRFVRQAIMELGLDNVEAIAARVEDYPRGPGFDTVVARAFASFADIRQRTSRLLAPDGRILALKGRVAPEEVRELETENIKVHVLRIPGCDIERRLIESGAD